MAFSLAQLEAIEAAIVSGAKSISYEGKSISYTTIDEMLRARAIIRRALGLTAGSQMTLVAHNKGIIPSRGDLE